MLKQKVFAGALYPLLWLVRFLVSLRYKIEVRGLDKLPPGDKTLFLPNHPAEMDPVILELVLWRQFRPRPLVVEHFYRLKGFRFFMDLVGAMPLPTMDTMANKWRGKKVEAQFSAVAEELRRGGNFLIYPSGRLKLTGLEVLGGASFVHKLLQAAPETRVVLVRTTGLWGSQFSRALTGSSPDFGRVLGECVKILLKNGIFFAPRRKVLVEVELPGVDFPRDKSRLEFNRYLEGWYNRYPEVGPEPLELVSFAFWKEEVPGVFVASAGGAQEWAAGQHPVAKKVVQEVFAFLAGVCGRAGEGQIERTMHLSNDLGLDSLDLVQVYVFLDERYGVTDLLPGDVQRVEDVLQFASGYKKAREVGAEKGGKGKQRVAWPQEEEGRKNPEIPPGETLQEVFLRSLDRNGSSAACLDALSGVLSYRKLKIGALVLAEKFRHLPGDRIGVMMPSSAGTYLIILSVLLAGKVPVMLNWTAGVRSLDHSATLAALQAVITSAKFLDRLENGELGKVEGMLHMIEEIREKVTFLDRCRAVLLSCRGADALLKKLRLTAIKPSDPGVILFTSGTESLPKGVPLSHLNILSNQRAAMSAVEMLASDIFYGVLPPFHAFGFSATGLLPLFAGVRVCYSPDPTDSHGMAREIAQWGATVLCCAPSFIRALFRVALKGQLDSLRLVVSGAEKTPQELFDYVREQLPNTQILEGYGITECSPIVTLDRLLEPHIGVGRAIGGVELMILDGSTLQPVEADREGEVCIAGPGIFNGYLGSPREPFIDVQGKRWYLSGDRGRLDREGHLILSGRLKRFVKIGGEMVSLGGLEEELLRVAKERAWVTGQEEGPPLAVVGVQEKEGDKPMLILYTTFSLAKEDVNRALREGGYGRIAKIAEVHTLEQIPLTGTGKTHYRLLEEMGSD